MTLPDAEKESPPPAEPERPTSLAEVERLRDIWCQLREADEAPARDLHLPNPERLLRNLEKLRLGAPPDGLSAEVAEVWNRHAESWGAPAVEAQLVEDLTALRTAIDRNEAQRADKLRQVELLRARCELLERLGQVLDRLAGLSPVIQGSEIETGGES